MLVPRIDRTHPHARAFETFWLMAHAPAATLDGWRVAVWSDRQATIPADMPQPGPGDLKAVLGWPATATEPGIRAVPLSEFPRVRGFDARSIQVVLAHHGVGPEVEAVLLAIGFQRDVPRQLPGWWLLHESEEPKQAARGRPGSALLLDERAERALVLVEVNGRFIVLSTRALWSYTFGPPLAHGETVRFVARESDGTLSVRAVTLDDPLSHAEVRRTFGAEAASRLRADGKAVAVRISA